MQSEAVKLAKEQNHQKNLDHLWDVGKTILNNKPMLMILGFVVVEGLKHTVIDQIPAEPGRIVYGRFPWQWPVKYEPGHAAGEDTLLGPTQALLLEAGIIMWGMGVTPADLVNSLKGIGGIFAKAGLEAPGLLQ